MFHDAMYWHASMLQNIIQRNNHPDMEIARQLGAIDQGPWRQSRAETKREARERFPQGKHLAMDRDTKKRKYDDMSATEQQILEDFDTHKLRKDHDEARAKKVPPFQGFYLSESHVAQQTTTASASSSSTPHQ